MKKFFLKTVFLFLALTAFNVQSRAQQSHPDIYGILRYSNAELFDFGIYSISPINGGTINSYWIDPEMMGNGGAVYVNGKYYILSFLDFGDGMLFASYLKCNVEQMYYDYEMPEIDISYIASDLTYDSSNNTVYACSMDISGDGTFWLSRMDVVTGVKEGIAKMPHMGAIAANPEGVLYGIGMDGILYTINKNTAEVTQVGPTGVTPINDQSATFDPETGILYWSAYTEQGGAMYTVDTATGKAELYCTYPNGEQITGIFIKNNVSQVGIPSSAENLIFDFNNSELTGKITFTLPTTDVEGSPLEGELTYGLSVDNDTPLEGVGQPGEVVSYTVSELSEGMHMFVITVSNDAGKAIPLNVDKYIGMDAPAAPIDVVATVEGNSVVLTWNMPETGKNGGYVDKSQLYFNIVRHYDNATIGVDIQGNSFTDTFKDTSLRACRYEIIPRIGNYVGNSAFSEDITIGEYMNVPFEHNLANIGDYKLYTVFDANYDKDTWLFGLYPEYSDASPCATYLWTVTETNDDWFFSPYIYLESGKTYEAKYSLRSEDNIYAGEVEVMLGTDKMVDAMNPVSDRQAVDYKNFRELTTQSFSVEETGTYVLGLHVCGNRSKYYIYLNGVNVYEADKTGISSAEVRPMVYVRDGVICVNNASGSQISVYDAAGVEILNTTEANIELKVAAGLYVVRAGGNTMKLIVR